MLPIVTTRRALLRNTAVVAVGTALLASGCDDVPGGPGGDVDRPGTGGSRQQTPTLDPAVAAALTTVTGHLGQLSSRYAAVVRRHPSLKARLQPAIRNHAAQLTRLRALSSGATPSAPTTAKTPAIAATPTAALADLAAREQALAVAHATAAAGLSGEPARLLASIAAGETQLALSLAPKPKKTAR